jgi:multidrug efflux pump subunit AcrA (membrane-fusion protein)
VPDVAVGTEQSERFLLTVGPDDVVVSRPVKLGQLFGSLRAIAEGLKPGERVIVNGLQVARPGSKVAPKEEPISAQAIAALETPAEREAAAGAATAARP